MIWWLLKFSSFVSFIINEHYIETSGTAGVYAETDFKESDLVLKDQMLAGAQHSSNKVLVIELAIHMFLLAVIIQLLYFFHSPF